ncbi:MAG: hypothetical protein JWQ87_5536, partial [Candidatus Sulfotelmatobacter sp.]|nr:hypothetical protein [Candidatus Sulfotelmatobacter sp.]
AEHLGVAIGRVQNWCSRNFPKVRDLFHAVSQGALPQNVGVYGVKSTGIVIEADLRKGTELPVKVR